MRAKARHGFEIPKPTREALRAAFTYEPLTDSFWWIRNTAKRIRHREAGYFRRTVKSEVRMINFGGLNFSHETIKSIFFSEATDDSSLSAVGF